MKDPIRSEEHPCNRTRSNPESNRSQQDSHCPSGLMGRRNLSEPQDRAGLAPFQGLCCCTSGSDFHPAPVGQQLNHFSTIKNPFHLCKQL